MSEEEVLREIGNSLSEEVKARLRELHSNYWSCAAWAEGQTCCVEHLTGDAPDA